MPDSTRFFWLFFRFTGRVSRAAYFLAAMLLALVPAFLLYRFSLVPEDSTAAQGWASAFMLAFLASLWSNVALSVKRLHDINRPGLLAVALFVPVISIIAFLVLCFLPGDQGPNQYGTRTNAPA